MKISLLKTLLIASLLIPSIALADLWYPTSGTLTPVTSGFGSVKLTGSATSTAVNGFNITGGCYAIGGVCEVGGGGAVTSISQTYGTGQTGNIVLATTSDPFNGLNLNEVITNSGGTFTFSNSVTGTLNNAGLTNSTISGVALGSNLFSHSTNSSLVGTGYNGTATVSNWGLNLANSNWWTALQNFTNASTSQITATSSAYFATTGGQVGIGTTSPYDLLSVAGEVVAQDFVATSTTASSTFAGAVGIGTTTPYSMLSVAGQVVGQNFIATSTTATSTFATGVIITKTKSSGGQGPDLGDGALNVTNIQTEVAGDVQTGIYAKMTNNGSGAGGHAIGVLGRVFDTTSNIQGLWGLEGRVDSVCTSTCAPTSILGDTFWQGSSFAGMNAYGIQSQVNVTTDGSQALGQGLAAGFFAPYILGGATSTRYSLWGQDAIRIDTTFATSTFASGGLTVASPAFTVQQNSGNVGINTTTPDTNLVVNGAIKLGTNSSTNLGASAIGLPSGSLIRWSNNANNNWSGGTMTGGSGGNNDMAFSTGGNQSSYIFRTGANPSTSAVVMTVTETGANSAKWGFNGTSTPFATISATTTIGIIPFAISTTTTAVSASTTLFMIDQAGDIHLGGGTPTLSSCGTSPELDGDSTDQTGTIIVGATTASCTLTFSTPKITKPHCSVSSQTGTIAISYTETTSTLVVTNATLGGDLVDYNCHLGH